MNKNFDPYEALKKVSLEYDNINFEGIMLQKRHIALLNRLFEDCDLTSLNAIENCLKEFFSTTNIYLRIIKNPINKEEKDINTSSLEKIKKIAEDFYAQSN